MPPDKLRLIFDSVGQDYDLGDFNSFRQTMARPEKRKTFYTATSRDYNLGEFGQFDSLVASSLPETAVMERPEVEPPVEIQPQPASTAEEKPMLTAPPTAVKTAEKAPKKFPTAVRAFDIAAKHFIPETEKAEPEKPEFELPTISEAPEKSLVQKILGQWEPTSTEKIAHAQNVYQIAKQYNLPISKVRHQIKLADRKGGMDSAVNSFFTSAIAFGMATHAPATLAGIGAFMAIKELVNAGVSIYKDEKYQALAGKGLADLLPEESSHVLKKTIEAAELIGTISLMGAGIKMGKPTFEKFTKDIVVDNKAPQYLYIEPEQVKAATGEGKFVRSLDRPGVIARIKLLEWLGITGDKAKLAEENGVAVPVESVTWMVDKPWFHEIKNSFRLMPAKKAKLVDYKLKPVEGTPTSDIGEVGPTPVLPAGLPEKPSAIPAKPAPVSEGRPAQPFTAQPAPEEVEKYERVRENIRALSEEQFTELSQANIEEGQADPNNRDYQLIEQAFAEEAKVRAVMPKTKLGKMMAAITDAGPREMPVPLAKPGEAETIPIPLAEPGKVETIPAAEIEAAKAEEATGVKEEVKAEEKAKVEKEPWEMTLNAFLEDIGYKKKEGTRVKENWRGQHEGEVRSAVEQGKPVPAEVLKDYPDLKAKAGKAGPEVTKLPKRVTKSSDQVTVKTEIPTTELDTEELVQHVKASYPQEAAGSLYSRFVQMRDLKPEISAKEFVEIFNRVSAKRAIEVKKVKFAPTHTDDVTNQKVQITSKPDGTYAVIWESGMTGGEIPGALPERYKPIKPAVPVAPKVEKPVEEFTVEQRAVIGTHVAELGSIEKVAEYYPGKGKPDTFARERAEELFGEGAAPKKEAAQEAFLDESEFPVQRVSVKDIRVSPEDFQFKRDVDERGIQEGTEIKGEFRPLAAGNVLVWQAKDGTMFVVNGHHRLAKAQDEGLSYINAQIIKETDGYTKDQAKTLGALTNIEEGRGTSYDWVEFFKETDISETQSRKYGLEGQAFRFTEIAGNDLLASFRNRHITPEQAFTIAETAGKDEAVQAIGMRLIQTAKEKGQKLSPDDLANQIRANIFMKENAPELKAQRDLFGETHDAALELSENLAKIATRHQKELKEIILALRNVNKDNRLEIMKKTGLEFESVAEARKVLEKAKADLAKWQRWESDPDLRKVILSELNKQGIQKGLFEEAKKPVEVPEPEAVEEKPEVEELTAEKRAIIGKHVEELGSVKAVKERYPSDSEVDIYARERGEEFFKKTAEKPAAEEEAAELSKLEASKRVKFFRSAANTLQKQIDAKRHPTIGEQRLTARRARIADGMSREADNLEKIQNILRGMADDIEAGTLPKALEGIKSKTHIEDIFNRTWQGARPGVRITNVKELLNGLKGVSGVSEIRDNLRELFMRKPIVEGGYYVSLYRESEIEALEKLVKVAEKKGLHRYTINDVKDEVKKSKRMISAGLDTEEKFNAAKKAVENYLKPPSEEVVKEQKLKAMERELIGTKIPGFFATPKSIVNKMLDKAEIESGMSVLEPSAGKGDIADEIKELDVGLDIYEINPRLVEILRAKDYKAIQKDFLEISGKFYQRIVMNPPFEQGQDIDHVKKAYELLMPGGRIVSLMSESPFFRSDKKATAFREWLEEVGGESEKAPEKAFATAESFRQTGVSFRIVTIDKPLEDAPSVPAERGLDEYERERGEIQFTTRPATTAARPGMGLVRVERVLSGIKDKFKIPIRVLGSVENLEGRTREAAQNELKRGNVISGFYNPQANEIVILADGVRNSDELLKLIIPHEITHYGTKGMLGEKAYAGLLKDLQEDRVIGPEVRKLMKKNGWKADYAASEWWAGNAEGANFDNLKKPGLIQRVIFYLKKWLRKVFGNKRVRFSDAEIKDLLRQSYQYARREEGKRAGAETPLMKSEAAHQEWYSQMQNVLEQKLPGKGTAQSYRQTIESWANKGEFKAEELEWSGLLEDETSPLQKEGKLSKDEILSWLDDNNVQVKEVRKGEKAVLTGEVSDLAHEIMKTDPSVLFEEATEQALLQLSPTKFSAYVLPGGENYREVLLTLPVKPDVPWAVVDKKTRGVLQWAATEAEAKAIAANNPDKFDVEQVTRPTDVFTATHWEEPNVLAHLRLTDRTDAEGNKVLFVEEIQSDWGLAGRRRGWKDVGDLKELRDKQTRLQEEMSKQISVYQDRYIQLGGRIKTDDKYNNAFEKAKDIERQLEEVSGKIADVSYRDVPRAPFVEKSWPLLVMKKALRIAAEEGYDKIGWVTGEQTAERYDLSKKISRITYTKAQVLRAYDLNGEQVISRKLMDDSELDDYIGKDVAKKLLAQEEKPIEKTVTGIKFPTRELSGLDLKVGGEWAKNLYDQMLPNIVNKYVKKWGGKAGESGIDAGEHSEVWTVQQVTGYGESTLKPEYAILLTNGTYLKDATGKVLYFDTKEKAKRAIKDYYPPSNVVNIHSLSITPTMRQSALMGQPLFRAKGEDRPVLRVDEHGKNIVWEQGDYSIAVNNPQNATHITLWAKQEVKGKEYLRKIGTLSAYPKELKVEGEFKKYIDVSAIEIEKPYRNKGLGLQMYRTLMRYAKAGTTGIVSYVPNRVNKRQISSIYKRLGAYEVRGGDYQIIPIAETSNILFRTRPTTDRQARLLSLFESAGGQPVERTTFELPPETRWEYLKRYIQNSMNRLATVQKQVKKTGKEITPDLNAYQQSVLEIGRATDQVEKFRDRMIAGKNSFVKRLIDGGIDVDDFGDYLTALHTPERRRVMIEKRIERLESKPETERRAEKIDDLRTRLADKDDSFGSGMSENEAAQIIAEMQKDHPAITEFADEFYQDVTEAALQRRLDAGLISEESYQAMKDTYRNYVPLKGKAGIESAWPGIGKKSGIMTSGIRRAKGRESQSDNPFIQAMVDYTDAIVRAEQNKVRQSFLRLVEDNPEPAVWETQKLQYMPVYDENGEIQYYDPLRKYADNVLEVMNEGKVTVITIKDAPLAEAMKNLGMERSFKTLAAINSYLRAVNIMLSPEFLITNFERDLQTALVNISGEESAKLAAQVTKGIPGAMKGIWSNLHGKGGAWAGVYAELKEAGGKVSWMNLESTEEMAGRVEKELRHYRGREMMPKRILKQTGRLIENSNEMVEMGVRLSYYKALRDSGKAAPDAAQAAKELTVNFNTRGQIGPLLNSLYLFANAGIQGSFRMFRALKHRRVQQIVVGLALLSFIQSLFNRWMDEDDWERMSDYNKDNYWLFMLPNDKAVGIKVPYGYNIFKVIGNLVEEAAFGNLTFAQTARRFFGAANDAFNPLGGGSLSQLVSPTATDVFVQIGENKNFFGGPIYKEQAPYQPAKPRSQMYFKRVNVYARRLTDWLNRLTGGTEKVSGVIDVNPELLDHLIDFVGGGLGRFITNSVNLGATLLTERDTPEIGKIPMVRQFLKEPWPGTDTRTIYDLLDESQRNVFGERESTKFADAIRRASKEGMITEKQREQFEKEFQQNQADALASTQGHRSRESILDEWESYYALPKNARPRGRLEELREAHREYNKKAKDTGQKLITTKLLRNASRRGQESRRKAG